MYFPIIMISYLGNLNGWKTPIQIPKEIGISFVKIKEFQGVLGEVDIGKDWPNHYKFVCTPSSLTLINFYLPYCVYFCIG